MRRVEDGTVTLVGATMENPSFALIEALLSRAQVLVLNRLDRVAPEAILRRLARFGADDIGLAEPERRCRGHQQHGRSMRALAIPRVICSSPVC